ncbi:MAG: hypothetical protein M1826_001092 [Phylliscum demangeonii]|nr:MAG: hypothetical protein M1826_001092 [Phylliscum demangeonii]
MFPLRIWLACAALAAVSTLATPIAEQKPPEQRSAEANRLKTAAGLGVAALVGVGLTRARLATVVDGLKRQIETLRGQDTAESSAAADRETIHCSGLCTRAKTTVDSNAKSKRIGERWTVSTQIFDEKLKRTGERQPANEALLKQIQEQGNEIARLQAEVESQRAETEKVTYQLRRATAELQDRFQRGIESLSRKKTPEGPPEGPPGGPPGGPPLWTPPASLQANPKVLECIFDYLGVPVDPGARHDNGEGKPRRSGGFVVHPKESRSRFGPFQEAGRGVEVRIKADAARAKSASNRQKSVVRKQEGRARRKEKSPGADRQAFTLPAAPGWLRHSWHAAVHEGAQLERALTRTKLEELPVVKFAKEHP